MLEELLRYGNFTREPSLIPELLVNRKTGEEVLEITLVIPLSTEGMKAITTALRQEEHTSIGRWALGKWKTMQEDTKNKLLVDMLYANVREKMRTRIE